MVRGHNNQPAKLPTKQLAILAVARFAEPLAYTSVTPYLPKMISDFGVDKDEVAFWAGLTSATFSVFQALTAVAWGRAADNYGRKPVLIVGLLSTMICFLIWGVSTSLAMAIMVRAIQGGGNGNVGIIRTMVAEMVPQKELQPRAFSIMPLVWSLGSVVGPAFGGFFAQPAEQYPGFFGDNSFFKKYPYALPNLMAAVFFIISTASATLFLKETLASKREKKDWGLLVGQRLTRAFSRKPTSTPRRRSFMDGEATAPLLPSRALPKHGTTNKPPKMSEVFTYQTVINLLAYTFLAFHSVAYDQNIAVFMYYPVKEKTPDNLKLPFYFNGGFGMSSGQTGSVFVIYGIVCGVVQFLLYTPLVKTFGVHRCFKACSVVVPFVYAITPYTSLFPTYNTRFAALMCIMIVKSFCIIVAFPSTTILLTNSCTSLRVLGTLNGFATMFSAFGRALGPASTGLAFTWGVEHGYIVTAYFYLAIIAAIGAIPVFLIVEGEGPTASAVNSESEDDDDDDDMQDSAVFLPDDSAIDDDDDNDHETDHNASAPLLRNGRQKTYGAT